MNKRIATSQWAQLLVLSLVHFLVDMFSNMPPSILPVIRQEFALSLFLGGIVLVVLYMAANGVQMLTGHLRADKAKPLFMHLGLVSAASLCLLAAVPRTGSSISVIILLAVISGCGIAVVHPEGLRAVHSLSRIPPAVSTAVFMAGGFLGFAGGGAVSTNLVSRFGLEGLYPLIACPAVGVLMVILLRVRLAVEPTPHDSNEPANVEDRLSFWLIIAMAVPAAISTTVLVSLLPTALNEAGFELTFGGFSAMMFGLGGALGSFVWAWIAHKRGELHCCVVTLLLVLPVLGAYLIFMDNRTAVWLLLGVGFFSIAAYILMITLARGATGPNLGQRMAFIVGGTWAVANLVFLVLLPAAEHFGTRFVLGFTPLGYLLSGIFGLSIMLKSSASGRRIVVCQR